MHLFFLFVLSGLSSSGVIASDPLPEVDEPTARTWVYRCANDVSVVSQIRGDDALVWFPQAGYQVLPRAMAASGNKYAKGELVFWSKDGEAFIREGELGYFDCSADYRAAVWEDAKLRGVQFRASGNEPGWFLEINPGRQQLVLVTAYGQQRLQAHLSEPEVDRDTGTSRYRVTSPEGDIEITIEGRSCHDSMSGEPFEARVTVKSGDSQYRGCGRTLY